MHARILCCVTGARSREPNFTCAVHVCRLNAGVCGCGCGCGCALVGACACGVRVHVGTNACGAGVLCCWGNPPAPHFGSLWPGRACAPQSQPAAECTTPNASLPGDLQTRQPTPCGVKSWPAGFGIKTARPRGFWRLKAMGLVPGHAGSGDASRGVCSLSPSKKCVST